uniref:Uncharacterized protein n=1 Tax=Knipowitschia caucasica TaxID=637954 RepID=A0AAV2KWJ7_KNICA
MEWQTPAVSEKFQSRFGRRPGTSDSGDTGIGTSVSDSTEDFCSTSSSPSFQPIRSQISIPTAHVMPSTAGSPASKSGLQGDELSSDPRRFSSGSRTQGGSTSKSSSLSKSASSPNLDLPLCVGPETVVPKSECLSRFRSMVNGLDQSLFPDHTRIDEGQRFDTPALEPTLNQSALLGELEPDVRFRLQPSGIRDTDSDAYRGAMEHRYKVLPEARTGASEVGRGGQASTPASCGLYSSIPLSPQTQALLREHPGAPQSLLRDHPLRAERSELSSWQQQQHKHQLGSLRLQVEQMQLMGGGVAQYPSLYSSSAHSDSGKWDALVKASESLLKEKELVIERQKQHMAQLEQRLRESELQVHGALLGRGTSYGDMLMLRLQVNKSL